MTWNLRCKVAVLYPHIERESALTNYRFFIVSDLVGTLQPGLCFTGRHFTDWSVEFEPGFVIELDILEEFHGHTYNSLGGDVTLPSPIHL